MALNPSSSESLEIQGTADIDAKACSVQVNSTSNAALYQNGTATLKASQINVVGSAYGSNFTPTPSVGVKPVPDPLAAKFATDYAAAWSAAVNRTAPTAGGTTTIYPGKYPGFSINNGGRVTMTAGVYFIVGGTLNIKAGGELIATDGVTIILTDANVNNPVNSSSKITVQAQGNLTIKAPASGPFAGIALAQHPNSRPGLTKTTANNIQGGGTVDLTGIVYYPQQIFYITGAGSIQPELPHVRHRRQQGHGRRQRPAAMSAELPTARRQASPLCPRRAHRRQDRLCSNATSNSSLAAPSQGAVRMSFGAGVLQLRPSQKDLILHG